MENENETEAVITQRLCRLAKRSDVPPGSTHFFFVLPLVPKPVGVSKAVDNALLSVFKRCKGATGAPLRPYEKFMPNGTTAYRNLLKSFLGGMKVRKKTLIHSLIHITFSQVLSFSTILITILIFFLSEMFRGKKGGVPPEFH